MSILDRIFRPVFRAVFDWSRPAKAAVIASFLLVFFTTAFHFPVPGYKPAETSSMIFVLVLFLVCSASPYVETGLIALIVVVESGIDSWGKRILIIIAAAGTIIFLTSMAARYASNEGGKFFAVLFWLYSFISGTIWSISLPRVFYEAGAEVPDTYTVGEFFSSIAAPFASRPTLFIALLLSTLGAHLMLRREAVYTSKLEGWLSE